MGAPFASLGSGIKKARADKKMTQEKLAELVGVSPNHLKQLEGGRRKPSIRVLGRLVEVLDLSLDSLYMSSDDDSDEVKEIKSKINLCLNRCSVKELQVAYAAIEATVEVMQKNTE